MVFFRRNHRTVRALLFVIVLCGIVAAWREAMEPRPLDLATLGQFRMIFVIIWAAGFVTHRIAPWVAPLARGQVDEDIKVKVSGKTMPRV